jgi:hypothetical protein
MRFAAWQRVLSLSALLLASGGAPAQPSDKFITAYVDGDREAVIAFLPPSMSRTADAAASEYPVISAVEAIRRCLSAHRADYRVVFADRIVIRSREGDEVLAAPLAGVLLLRPGSNPRIVFAGGGPEAVAPLLRQESLEYFGEDCAGKVR